MSDSPFNIINEEENTATGKAYSNDDLNLDPTKRIEKMIGENKIFIFVKGTPDFPQCGFSFNTMDIFKRLGKNYQTFDVLSDPSIRQGIKDFTNWPTIPQIFINGEFIGGNDIVTSMFQSGELKDMIIDC